ncbi:MAG: TetR/AcrR family transcriptional regulator [Chthoniobacteraceae bacterium]
MISTDERRSEKRRAILDAARRCFIRHGFDATGMAEICEVSGMSPGALYRYFPSKSAIILAIVDEAGKVLLPVYEELLENDDPLESVIGFVLSSIRYVCRPVEGRLWLEIAAQASRNDEIRRAWLLVDRQMRSILKRLLHASIQQGQVSPGVNLETCSIWLNALVDGAIARKAVDPAFDLESTLGALADGIRNTLSLSRA